MRTSRPLRGLFTSGPSPTPAILADKRRFRIVLAEVFLDLLVRDPLDRPAPGPGPRVRSWVVYRHFVLQCIEVRSREAFGEVKGFGMGKSPVRHPKPLIEADRLDDQCIPLPSADGSTVVAENQFSRLTDGATICIDDSPIAVPAP